MRYSPFLFWSYLLLALPFTKIQGRRFQIPRMLPDEVIQNGVRDLVEQLVLSTTIKFVDFRNNLRLIRIEARDYR